MGIKKEDGTVEDRCLPKLLPGEYFFLLRARDASAPSTISGWLAVNHKNLSPEHVTDTLLVLHDILNWQHDNRDKVKDPD